MKRPAAQESSPLNYNIFFFSQTNRVFTAVAVVVHQDYLLEQVRRRVVDDAVDRAQDHRQGLVHEDEDHGDLRKILRVRQLLTPVRMESRQLACANQA